MAQRKRISKGRRGTAELISFQKTSGAFHGILKQPGITTPLAWDLFQEGVISQSVRDDITNIMLSDSQKASKLLRAVESAIATNRRYYRIVREIFSNHDVQLEEAVKQMENTIAILAHDNRFKKISHLIEQGVLVEQESLHDAHGNSSGVSGSTKPLLKRFCYFTAVCFLAFAAVCVYVWYFQLVSSKFNDQNSSPVTDPNFHHKVNHTETQMLDSCTLSQSKTFESEEFNLPSAPEPFVGRERKLKEVLSDLMDKSISIVGIHGPPGFGKSALAVHVGHRLVSSKISVRYMDMNEFSLLKPQVSVNIVIKDTLNGSESDMQKYESGELTFVKPDEASHTSDSPKSSKLKNRYQLLEWARRIRTTTILILDNCDEILNHAQNDFQILIKQMVKLSLNNLKFVMTGQQNIMFIDNFAPHNVSELSLSAAELLLRNLTDTTITSSEVKDLSELVGYCPLTLKVAAKLLGKNSIYTPSLLVKTLREDLNIVVSNKRFPKNERFMVLMHLAFRRLSGEMQNCLHFVSLFPGSFSSEAALKITLCGDVLSELVYRSLLQQYSHTDSLRYSVHKLIRSYFQQILVTKKYRSLNVDNTNKFSLRFRHYYSSLAVRYSLLLTQGNISAAKEVMNIDKHNFDKLLYMILNGSEEVKNVSEAVVIILAYRENVLTDDFHLSPYLSLPTNKFMSVCNIVGNSTCLGVLVKLIFESHSTGSCSVKHELRVKITQVYNTTQMKYDEVLPDKFVKFYNTLKYSNCVCTFGYFVSLVTCTVSLLVAFAFNLTLMLNSHKSQLSVAFIVSIRLTFWIVMLCISFENHLHFYPLYVVILQVIDIVYGFATNFYLVCSYVPVALFSAINIVCSVIFSSILFSLTFVLPSLCDVFSEYSDSTFLKASLLVVSAIVVINIYYIVIVSEVNVHVFLILSLLVATCSVCISYNDEIINFILSFTSFKLLLLLSLLVFFLHSVRSFLKLWHIIRSGV